MICPVCDYETDNKIRYHIHRFQAMYIGIGSIIIVYFIFGVLRL